MSFFGFYVKKVYTVYQLPMPNYLTLLVILYDLIQTTKFNNSRKISLVLYTFYDIYVIVETHLSLITQNHSLINLNILSTHSISTNILTLIHTLLIYLQRRPITQHNIAYHFSYACNKTHSNHSLMLNFDVPLATNYLMFWLHDTVTNG